MKYGKICYSHGSDADYTSCLGCDTVSFGVQFLML